MSNKKYQKFLEVFKDLVLKNDKIAIFMHTDPYLGAFGVKWILYNLYRLESVIFFDGEIIHRQNQTLLNVLNVMMTRFKNYIPTEFIKTIVVDSSLKNTQNNHSIVLINHHKTIVG